MKALRIAAYLLVVTVILATASSGFGLVLAQGSKLSVSGRILLLRGDYSEGSLEITNPMGHYSVVYYQTFTVKDLNGNEVEGFTLNVTPRYINDWSAGDVKVLHYNISCGDGVVPGNYTLYLRFVGISSGKMEILYATVPLTVTEEALDFGDVTIYVPGRGDVSYVFSGEVIELTHYVLNRAHRTVGMEVSVSFENDGKVYFQKSQKFELTPGDNVITMELPVGYRYPEGNYTIKYLAKYGSGTFSFSKDITLRLGIEVVGVSLESREISYREKAYAYVTILSEKSEALLVEANTYTQDGSLIASWNNDFEVSPGSTVLKIPLFSNFSGNLTEALRILVHGEIAWEQNISYRVTSPPRLLEVSHQKVSPTKVMFRVVVSSEEDNVPILLRYVISSEKAVIYNNTLEEVLNRGINEFVITLSVPEGERLSYRFILEWDRGSAHSSGELYIQPTESGTESQRPSGEGPESSTPTIPPTEEEEDSGHLWYLAGVIVAAVLLGFGLYYYSSERNTRKRVRPKPKRRSPLGRFRRPKKPKFWENKELPKKK